MRLAVGIAGWRAPWPSCPLAQLNLTFSTPTPSQSAFRREESEVRNAVGPDTGLVERNGNDVLGVQVARQIKFHAARA
jgi:hypothetical protein